MAKVDYYRGEYSADRVAGTAPDEFMQTGAARTRNIFTHNGGVWIYIADADGSVTTPPPSTTVDTVWQYIGPTTAVDTSNFLTALPTDPTVYPDGLENTNVTVNEVFGTTGTPGNNQILKYNDTSNTWRFAEDETGAGGITDDSVRVNHIDFVAGADETTGRVLTIGAGNEFSTAALPTSTGGGTQIRFGEHTHFNIRVIHNTIVNRTELYFDTQRETGEFFVELTDVEDVGGNAVDGTFNISSTNVIAGTRLHQVPVSGSALFGQYTFPTDVNNLGTVSLDSGENRINILGVNNALTTTTGHPLQVFRVVSGELILRNNLTITEATGDGDDGALLLDVDIPDVTLRSLVDDDGAVELTPITGYTQATPADTAVSVVHQSEFRWSFHINNASLTSYPGIGTQIWHSNVETPVLGTDTVIRGRIERRENIGTDLNFIELYIGHQDDRDHLNSLDGDALNAIFDYAFTNTQTAEHVVTYTNGVGGLRLSSELGPVTTDFSEVTTITGVTAAIVSVFTRFTFGSNADATLFMTTLGITNGAQTTAEIRFTHGGNNIVVPASTFVSIAGTLVSFQNASIGATAQTADIVITETETVNISQLTAGNNVTFANSNGNITIASTATGPGGGGVTVSGGGTAAAATATTLTLDDTLVRTVNGTTTNIQTKSGVMRQNVGQFTGIQVTDNSTISFTNTMQAEAFANLVGGTSGTVYAEHQIQHSDTNIICRIPQGAAVAVSTDEVQITYPVNTDPTLVMSNAGIAIDVFVLIDELAVGAGMERLGYSGSQNTEYGALTFGVDNNAITQSIQDFNQTHLAGLEIDFTHSTVAQEYNFGAHDTAGQTFNLYNAGSTASPNPHDALLSGGQRLLSFVGILPSTAERPRGGQEIYFAPTGTTDISGRIHGTIASGPFFQFGLTDRYSLNVRFNETEYNRFLNEVLYESFSVTAHLDQGNTAPDALLVFTTNTQAEDWLNGLDGLGVGALDMMNTGAWTFQVASNQVLTLMTDRGEYTVPGNSVIVQSNQNINLPGARSALGLTPGAASETETITARGRDSTDVTFSGSDSRYFNWSAVNGIANIRWYLPNAADRDSLSYTVNDGSGAEHTYNPGHTIHEEAGAALPYRQQLHFLGTGVTAADDAANNRTTVTIATGGLPTTVVSDLTTITTPTAGQVVLYNGPAFAYTDTAGQISRSTNNSNTTSDTLQIGNLFADTIQDARNTSGSVSVAFQEVTGGTYSNTTRRFSGGTVRPTRRFELNANGGRQRSTSTGYATLSTTGVANDNNRISFDTQSLYFGFGQALAFEGQVQGVPTGSCHVHVIVAGATTAAGAAFFFTNVSQVNGIPPAQNSAVLIPTEIVNPGLIFWDSAASKWRGF